MNRILKKLPPLATLIVLAACSEQAPTLAPEAVQQIALPAMPSVVAAEAVEARVIDAPLATSHGTFGIVYPSNAVTYQFTYDPRTSAAFIMGVQMVSFPAYTICDPATSGYGSSYWLSSCSKLTTPITITATTWTDSQGRPQVDFANSIRFYQNWNGQLPAIYLRDPSASLSSWGRIDYCPSSGACVNEATGDSVLGTQREAVTGYLFRLIRHFSGYNVWA
jgi:hypothetical protein